MTNEFVLEAITREFPEAVLSASEPYGLLTLEIKKEEIKKAYFGEDYVIIIRIIRGLSP